MVRRLLIVTGGQAVMKVVFTPATSTDPTASVLANLVTSQLACSDSVSQTKEECAAALATDAGFTSLYDTSLSSSALNALVPGSVVFVSGVTVQPSDSSSGLSSRDKKIIGGVIGGVGGAILIVIIALIWKSNQTAGKAVGDRDQPTNSNDMEMQGVTPAAGANQPHTVRLHYTEGQQQQ
jgi:di/tricarboxylate transporter